MREFADVRLVGIGGDEMKAAGVEIIHHVKEMSVMGFSEVISKLPFFARVRKDMIRIVRQERPDGVVLVDYPGFNLRFAKIARREGVKVFYYISPQVWAWGKRRIKTIRRTVDLMMTIFKFEEEMYHKAGVNAKFVGHPLLDEIKCSSGAEIQQFRRQFFNSHHPGNPEMQRVLALLPGSRHQEIKRILPTMLLAARTVVDELRGAGMRIEPIIGCAPAIDVEEYSSVMHETGVNAQLCHDVGLLMDSADAGMITSGTATLEAALHDLPMLVAYKTSPVTYFLGRSLVRLKSISLVNIVAGERIVEELVQGGFEATRAASIIKSILTNSEVSDRIKQKYAGIRKALGEAGASARAAELILKAA